MIMSSRRRFLIGTFVPATVSACVFDHRIQVLARHTCRGGPVVSLMVRGQLWKLTNQERTTTTALAKQIDAFDTP